MKATRFILRNPGILRNCLELIHGLPTDGTPYEVVIKRYRKPRSLNQNSYLHVLYGIMSEHTGFETKEIHDLCRDRLLPKKVIEIGGKKVEILASTTELNTQQMSDYIEGVIRFAAQDMDLALPPPAEVWAA